MASALDIASALSNCFCEQLTNTIAGSPSQCCITVDPSVVECCAGSAWIQVTGAYPSKVFPSPYSTPDRCRVDTWAMQFEIGIARCAPQPCEVTGDVCCEEDILAFQSQMSDFEAMRRTFTCCDLGVSQDQIIVGQYKNTIQGGCSYSTMQVTIRVADFCGCG